jgi:ABC-type bacteriocin/lantibiotic exporter with double-glycine peptidase domain
MWQIHSQMLESVLRAKMAFFSKTRAGSIIQRFGEDLVSHAKAP